MEKDIGHLKFLFDRIQGLFVIDITPYVYLSLSRYSFIFDMTIFDCIEIDMIEDHILADVDRISEEKRQENPEYDDTFLTCLLMERDLIVDADYVLFDDFYNIHFYTKDAPLYKFNYVIYYKDYDCNIHEIDNISYIDEEHYYYLKDGKIERIKSRKCYHNKEDLISAIEETIKCNEDYINECGIFQQNYKKTNELLREQIKKYKCP